MKRIFALLLYFLSFNINAQITFQKIYNGLGAAEDIKQTLDGGFIVTGPYYLLKLDSYGVVQWSKTYTGLSGYYQKSEVQQTSDGGYIIASSTDIFGAGNFDFMIIKTNSTGDTLWTKTYGGIGSEQSHSIQQTVDGGYIICGTKAEPLTGPGYVYLVKTDGAGNELWAKTYGAGLTDEGFSVRQTVDGGYIFAGGTYSEASVTKTDASGNIIWSKVIGGPDPSWDIAYSIRQTSDGGYILVGSAPDDTLTSDLHIYLIRLDASGSVTWAKMIAGSNDTEVGYCVEETNDGGYVITGFMYTGSNPHSILLCKTDSNGNLQWNNSIYVSGGCDAYSVKQTSDGGYVICGNRGYAPPYPSGAFVVKTDSIGNSGCNQSGAGFSSAVLIPQIDSMPPIYAIPLVSAIGATTTVIGSAGSSMTLCSGFPTTLNHEDSNVNENSVFLFPNPVANELTVQSSEFHDEKIHVEIYSALGKHVFSQPLVISIRQQVVINISSFPRGIYFVEVKAEGSSILKRKIVKM